MFNTAACSIIIFDSLGCHLLNDAFTVSTNYWNRIYEGHFNLERKDKTAPVFPRFMGTKDRSHILGVNRYSLWLIWLWTIQWPSIQHFQSLVFRLPTPNFLLFCLLSLFPGWWIIMVMDRFSTFLWMCHFDITILFLEHVSANLEYPVSIAHIVNRPRKRLFNFTKFLSISLNASWQNRLFPCRNLVIRELPPTGRIAFLYPHPRNLRNGTRKIPSQMLKNQKMKK